MGKFALALLVLVACTDAPDATDVAEELPRRLIRVDLRREAGTVSIARTEAVQIDDAATPPLPSVDGEYVVIGRAGGEVLESAFVSFPSVIEIEPGQYGGEHEIVPIDDATTTLFLIDDARLDTLEVRDSSNLVVASTTDIPHVDEATGAPSAGLSNGLAGTPYEHIRLLDGSNSWTELGLLGIETGEIHTPTQEQIQILLDGFSRATPEVVSAVSTVAFVDPAWLSSIRGPDWAGLAFGNTFILNASTDSAWLRGTVVHESAHNYTFLMNSVSSSIGTPSVRWDADVIAKAEDRLRRFKVGSSLRGGMVGAWEELQRSAVALGLAVDYQGSASGALPQSAVVANGFASKYGSTNAWEDIAEHVRMMQAADLRGETNAVCDRFRAGEEMEPYKALAYAKLNFLLSLGFISDSAFEACTIGFLPRGEDGIHLYYDTNASAVHFTEGAKAGYYDDGGTRMLAMLGSWADYDALLQVNPGEGAGLGAHRLDTIGLSNVGDSGLNGFYLAHTDEYRARVSQSGLVIVTQASPESGVEGLVFYLNLANGFGDVTDTFSWGTFRFTPR